MRAEQETRNRSGAEVAFTVMKALSAARLLWSDEGALPLQALPGLLSTPESDVALAVDRLCAEGVAEVSQVDQTVRLTERGAREICDRRPVSRMRPGTPYAA